MAKATMGNRKQPARKDRRNLLSRITTDPAGELGRLEKRSVWSTSDIVVYAAIVSEQSVDGLTDEECQSIRRRVNRQLKSSGCEKGAPPGGRQRTYQLSRGTATEMALRLAHDVFGAIDEKRKKRMARARRVAGASGRYFGSEAYRDMLGAANEYASEVEEQELRYGASDPFPLPSGERLRSAVRDYVAGALVGLLASPVSASVVDAKTDEWHGEPDVSGEPLGRFDMTTLREDLERFYVYRERVFSEEGGSSAEDVAELSRLDGRLSDFRSYLVPLGVRDDVLDGGGHPASAMGDQELEDYVGELVGYFSSRWI